MRAKAKQTKKTTRTTTTTRAKGPAVVNARRVGPETLARAAWARGEGFWRALVTEGERLREKASSTLGPRMQAESAARVH